MNSKMIDYKEPKRTHSQILLYHNLRFSNMIVKCFFEIRKICVS